jgi:hypothetical protein
LPLCSLPVATLIKGFYRFLYRSYNRRLSFTLILVPRSKDHTAALLALIAIERTHTAYKVLAGSWVI